MADPLKVEDGRHIYCACPLCASPQFRRILSADCRKHTSYRPLISPVIQWMKCGGCGHVFTHGYFTDESLAVVFEKTLPSQVIGYDAEKQRHVAARIIEKVLPFADSGFWLDVGFGNGALLFTALEYGFTPVGVDLRQDNAQKLAAAGVESHGIPVEQLDHPQRYSVISMMDVLEHVPFPGTALAAAKRLLRDDGVLLLSMPNMDAHAWKALNKAKANPYWAELEHYHNFGKRRLYELLIEHDLHPVRYGVSERYRVCMEVVALGSKPSGTKAPAG